MFLDRCFARKAFFIAIALLAFIFAIIAICYNNLYIRGTSMAFYNPDLNVTVRLGMPQKKIESLLGPGEKLFSYADYYQEEATKLDAKHLISDPTEQGDELFVSSYLWGEDALYVTYHGEKVVGLGTWNIHSDIDLNAFAWQLADNIHYFSSLLDLQNQFPNGGVYTMRENTDLSKSKFEIFQSATDDCVVTCSLQDEKLVSMYLCYPGYISNYVTPS